LDELSYMPASFEFDSVSWVHRWRSIRAMVGGGRPLHRQACKSTTALTAESTGGRLHIHRETVERR
jgi:hypothetical protein